MAATFILQGDKTHHLRRGCASASNRSHVAAMQVAVNMQYKVVEPMRRQESCSSAMPCTLTWYAFAGVETGLLFASSPCTHPTIALSTASVSLLLGS